MKMKKIKLNQLSEKEMSNLKGTGLFSPPRDGKYYMTIDEGGSCGCGCYYVNDGGSSIADNQAANYSG